MKFWGSINTYCVHCKEATGGDIFTDTEAPYENMLPMILDCGCTYYLRSIENLSGKVLIEYNSGAFRRGEMVVDRLCK